MRDPRIDPQPGDRVKGDGYTKLVTHRSKFDLINYEIPERGTTVTGCSLVAWQNWCHKFNYEVLETKGKTMPLLTNYDKLALWSEAYLKALESCSYDIGDKHEEAAEEITRFCTLIADKFLYALLLEERKVDCRATDRGGEGGKNQ